MKYQITDALKAHFLRYRKMTPQDTVKLIYQSEFGPGHLITNENYAFERLKAELEDTARDSSIPTVEAIGGDACRFNLASLPSDLSVKTLTRIFTMSAEMFFGNSRSFESKLSEVYTLIDEKYAPFSRHEYSEYLKKYFESGAGAVHHSLYYNALYRPAYRVVHASFVPILPILTEIDRRLSANERFTLKIDGRCGAGKSTLSETLRRIYGCGIIHADDFYPTKGSDSPLDFERMNNEINDILSGKSDSYNAFDCQKQATTEKIYVDRDPFLIVEGSYSLHPRLKLDGISVFVTVTPEIQLKRLEKRSPDKLNDFKTRWIPAEERYFAEFGTAENCELTVDTTEF